MKQIERIPTPPNWEKLKYHELSSLVEFGTGIDMDQLAADMRDNGYDEAEPIILLDGKILDGRHRHRGAIMADVTPTFAKFTGKNPFNYVKKKILRQHLNESQRAMLAAKIANLPRGANQHTETSGTSQAKAAAMLNVSTDSVGMAKKVQEHGTEELQEAVADGTITVSDAAKVVSEPPEVQREAVAEVKAGTSPTVAAAITNDPHLCFQCNRNKRTGQPPRKNCPDCPGKPEANGKPDREPGSDNRGLGRPREEQAEEPTDPVDGWGIPITPEATPAFEAQEKFDELLAMTRKIRKLYAELAEHPGGAYLTRKGISMNSKDSWKHKGLENLILNLKDCRPTYTICPYSFSTAPGYVHDANCSLCHGLNWVRPLGKEEVPESLVKAAKKHYKVKADV